MTTDDQTKPHYLGLLNAISIAERNAGVYHMFNQSLGTGRFAAAVEKTLAQ